MRIRALSYQVGFLLATGIVWEGLVRFGLADPFYFSSPVLIAQRLAQDLRAGDLLTHMGVTLVEILLGFAAGIAGGCATAVFFSTRKTLMDATLPVLALLNGIPRIAIAPVLILWFGIGLLSKVVLVFSAVYFIVAFTVLEGILAIDQGLINHARLLGAARHHVLAHIYFPAVLGLLISSLRVSLGFAAIGAVIGEYLASTGGVGWMIARSQGMFDSTGVFAGLVSLAVMIAALDAGAGRIQRSVPWNK